MKCRIFVDILSLIGIVYLFSMCTNGSKRNTYNDNITHATYNINHYIDTVCGHVILTTVCDDRNNNDISVSTLEIDNFSKTNND